MSPDLDTKRLGRLPTAQGRITRLAYACAREAGIDLPPLLKKSGLTKEQIEDNGARINVRHQISFLNLIANALHDDFLGFHLAQRADLRELGLMFYVAASSEIVAEAFERAARYSSISNEGISLEYLDDVDVRIMFHYVGVARYLDRHQIEFWMTALIRLCRELTGFHLAPSRVRLTHQRNNDYSDFAAFFNSDVGFGATTDEVAFAATIKHMPITSADPYLSDLLIKNCEDALSRRPRNRGSFQSGVENAVAPLLPHGRFQAGEIARRLGLSQRTFARRLTREGVTFSAILDRLRCDLARQYLANQSLPVSQIAWFLGYREVSAFTHAFKRWTGKTPREARAQRDFEREMSL